MIWLRSIGAVLAGMAAIVILSIATDVALRAVGVFPPFFGAPFTAPLLLLATAHRSAWTVLGGYLTARLAPRAATAHVLVLGGVGVAANLAGLIAEWHLGAHWYPIALTLLALPCAWLGGMLAGAGRRRA